MRLNKKLMCANKYLSFNLTPSSISPADISGKKSAKEKSGFTQTDLHLPQVCILTITE